MRVGVLGGGQLGRMLALAGAPLGVETVLLDPAADACAGRVAPLLVGAYDDPALLAELAAGSDVVTVELEQVPLAAFDGLAGEVELRPSRRSLEVTQDRLLEKRLCAQLGLPVPAFAPVDGEADLIAAAAGAVGLPLVLKTRYGGYDGKGQRVVRDSADLEPARAALGGNRLIAEQLLPFDREVSVVAVRGVDGELRAYPLVENLHAGGILRVSRPLAPAAGPVVEAQRLAGAIAAELGHVGVLAVELFEVDGHLLVNEIAPRVHNSGHWTIEGAETSQFENHLRAVCGLPLGSTVSAWPAAMVNLIGEVPAAGDVLAVAGARLHLYGKQPRPGRKLGHVTVLAPDGETLDERLAAVLALTPSA